MSNDQNKDVKLLEIFEILEEAKPWLDLVAPKGREIFMKLQQCFDKIEKICLNDESVNLEKEAKQKILEEFAKLPVVKCNNCDLDLYANTQTGKYPSKCPRCCVDVNTTDGSTKKQIKIVNVSEEEKEKGNEVTTSTETEPEKSEEEKAQEGTQGEISSEDEPPKSSAADALKAKLKK